MTRGVMCRFSGLCEGFASWFQGSVGEAGGISDTRPIGSSFTFPFFFHFLFSLSTFLILFFYVLLYLCSLSGREGGCKGHRGYWAGGWIFCGFFFEMYFILWLLFFFVQILR